jgi:DNA-directed RNA polymerase specialized sigma24 family protein
MNNATATATAAINLTDEQIKNRNADFAKYFAPHYNKLFVSLVERGNKGTREQREQAFSNASEAVLSALVKGQYTHASESGARGFFGKAFETRLLNIFTDEQKKATEGEDALPIGLSNGNVNVLTRLIQAEQVENILAKLANSYNSPERGQDAIELFIMVAEGTPYDGIAAQLGIALGTVKSRVSAIREKLAAIVGSQKVAITEGDTLTVKEALAALKGRKRCPAVAEALAPIVENIVPERNQAIYMAYLEGATFAEIGLAFGQTTNAAGSRINAANEIMFAYRPQNEMA